MISDRSLLFRIIRTIPGLMLLFFLIFIVLSFVVSEPIWDSLIKIFLLIFIIKGVVFFIGGVKGLICYSREKKYDWNNMLRQYDTKCIKNVILIPFYNESFEILDKTFNVISKSNYDLKKVIILLAVEERGGVQAIKNAYMIRKKYESIFLQFHCIIHPQGVEGEAIGTAAANRSFALKKFVENNIKSFDIKNYILTTFDSDLLISPQYLAAVTYKYITSKEKDYTFFFTPIYLFRENFKTYNFFSFLFSKMLSISYFCSESFWGLNSETFSIYSTSLSNAVKNNYWDPRFPADDSLFFWRYFSKIKRRFKGEIFYVPTYSSFVNGSSFFMSLISLYKQQLRWGWGAIAIPVFFTSILNRENFKFSSIVEAMIRLWDKYFMNLIIPPIILLFLIDIIFHGVNYDTFTVIFIIIVFGVLVLSCVLLIKFYGFPNSLKKIFRFLLELLISPVNAIFFLFIPWFHAQMEMLLGKETRKVFYVSDK